MPNIYQTTDGSPLGLAQVKERAESAAAAVRAEYEAAVENVNALAIALTETEDADALAALTASHAEAVKNRDALAAQAKSGFRFSPATGRKVNRYAVTDEVLAAWLAAEDAEARTAILAAVPKDKVHPQKSAISPSIAAYADMRAGWLSRAGDEPTRQGATAVMLADISSGALVVPSAARGASAASAEKLTPEQKRDRAAAAMFADLPDAEAPEDAPEDVPAETPKSARK